MIIAAENHLVCRLRCSGHLSFQRDLFFIALHIWTEWSSKEFAAILIWVLKPMWKLQYICISFASFANNWVHSYIQSSLFHLRTSMSLSSNIKGVWIFFSWCGISYSLGMTFFNENRPIHLVVYFLVHKNNCNMDNGIFNGICTWEEYHHSGQLQKWCWHAHKGNVIAQGPSRKGGY